MKYSPNAVKKAVRESGYSQSEIDLVWVSSAEDEERGGHLDGRANQTVEGDICARINGVDRVIGCAYRV